MNHEEDLKFRVHDLFQQVVDRLDPQIDKLISSSCGIVEDHVDGEYAIAKAFLVAFLRDEANNYRPFDQKNRELSDHYGRFL